MDLRELQYFVAVAEELHFARAAERVGINQSPLSKAITQMERHLGVRLFIRTRRSTQLTTVGETLLRDARRILADVDAAKRRLLAVASGHRGQLRVGLGEGLAHPRISRLIGDIKQDEPNIDIEVIHAPLPKQLVELRASRMDLGFVLSAVDVSQLLNGANSEADWGWAGEDIDVLPLWSDALVAVAKPGPILQSAMTLPELTAGPIILVGQRMSSCQSGEPLARPRQVQLEYVANVEVLLTLVGAGRGTGLIGAAQAETLQWTDLVVRPLESSLAHVETLLLRRKQERSTLVTRFVERAQRSQKAKMG
jgi:DNA-binding transcriptional LysR family regulator